MVYEYLFGIRVDQPLTLNEINSLKRDIMEIYLNLEFDEARVQYKGCIEKIPYIDTNSEGVAYLRGYLPKEYEEPVG